MRLSRTKERKATSTVVYYCTRACGGQKCSRPGSLKVSKDTVLSGSGRRGSSSLGPPNIPGAPTTALVLEHAEGGYSPETNVWMRRKPGGRFLKDLRH